ncbi:putative HTH-type transcriptional regulator YhjC [Teredinibacter turnerae T7901]|uniref:HTH-type transcriptional regulator YhjC n=1 Tax=Teredinibacter turnerae (strain ATCC 39867 / T7901) TaxID=377629 RepID=C5BJY6_TERTT|nr:LysR family transcriptional regulator [Teredinibacter turnerae]ACR12852.1 putative HTH-type transcriptional regulator YhjC [Teredinibacter turnerae T7901]
MDFIRQLQIFVTVAEMGSFTRAAESLHMARPGVTKAISELEKNVGVRLLQRTTRRTNLTGEGEALYTKATQLLRDVDVTQNLFGGSKERPSGRLRIDIPVALAKSMVIPALPGFRSLYPDISVILGVNDQPIDLIAKSVDCVLRLGQLTASSMIGRQIATIKMVVCASPEYLARKGPPRSIEALNEHLTINYFAGQKHTPLAWFFKRNQKIEEILLPSSLMANDAEAVVACALNHMGLIQVPGILVAEELHQGALVQVLEEFSGIELPLSIMYPNRQYLAPQVRTFINWVIDITDAQKGPWIR